MELQLFNNIQESASLEKKIKDAVSSMQPERRLKTIMDTIGMALEAGERFNEFITEAWELIIREHWWKGIYNNFDDFKSGCGLRDSVLESIEAKRATEKRKAFFEAGTIKIWGGESLRQILGDELIPINLSKAFLQTLRSLAQQINEASTAKPLLIEARNERLKTTGTIKDARLQLSDVRATLERMKRKNMRQSTTQLTTKTTRTSAKIKPQKLEESESEETVEKGILRTEAILILDMDQEEESARRCGCTNIERTKLLVLKIKEERSLEDKLKQLNSIDKDGWRQICHQHMRAIASCLELQNSRLKRDELIQRMIYVPSKRVMDLFEDEETREWFRKRGRPLNDTDKLGPFKYRRLKYDDFEFDRETIWIRYAGEGAMQTFFYDRNVVIKRLFDWIVKDSELMEMIEAEFDMYRHHLREQNGQPNLGWCRNMWHSLVQQAIRQDPAFYALNVVARRDKRWKLISFPYYTKYANPTGFKHIDLNIPRLLSSGKGESLVQTAVSMNDECKDRCTIIVSEFHKHIKEWWSKVVSRKKATNGYQHSVEHIYEEQDEDKYGEFKEVRCKRGDVRMTMASIIHGSTKGCDHDRKVVFPWLMGIEKDHESLELYGTCSWEEASRSHRDMTAIKKEPSGQSHHFGIGEEKFSASIELREISALSDALLGARRWNSKSVIRERNLVLGEDDVTAQRFVNEVREKMKKTWKESFYQVVAGRERRIWRKQLLQNFERFSTVGTIETPVGEITKIANGDLSYTHIYTYIYIYNPPSTVRLLYSRSIKILLRFVAVYG